MVGSQHSLLTILCPRTVSTRRLLFDFTATFPWDAISSTLRSLRILRLLRYARSPSLPALVSLCLPCAALLRTTSVAQHFAPNIADC
jgi:hypothetical protein